MSRKYALIIGNTEYTDPGLAQLTAPGKDTEDFARVLQDPEIGAFDDVKVLLNQFSSTIIEAIDDFFNHKKPDDLLVLYFSGHGVRDELGSLYLAVRNSFRAKLRSTAVKSDYIREVMDQSRSRRQVLILDCCNSGAFAQGTKAATGVSIGTASAFEAGYGRIILTASDSTQFAWEGDKVIGQTDNSLFTHYLVDGLKGEADRDGDGRITVDELYDYAYERVKLATPKQTPSKFSSKQQGEIVLRQNIRIEDVRPVQLPDELLDEVEDTRPYVREAAVQKLDKILKGRNIGLARSAREALEKIAADENTTRRVAQSAMQVLGSIPPIEAMAQPDEYEVIDEIQIQPPAVRPVESARAPQPEKDTGIQKSSGVEKQIEHTTSTSAWDFIFKATVAWAILGSVGGVIYDTTEIPSIAGVISGGLGGLILAITLQGGRLPSLRDRAIWIPAVWAIGAATGWTLGEEFTEATGMAFGHAIGVSISLAFTSALESIRLKSMLVVIAAWTVSAGVGWVIAKKMIDEFSMDYAISWAIGWGLAWGVAGFITTWQISGSKQK